MKVREPNTYRFTPKGLKAYRRVYLGTDRDLKVRV